ncbi:MAG: hypothetical protein HY077_08850 [Elusimicrobia bacterium]|nr:hypothetical protein [Elusimicrobiota bacterium]
MAARDYYPLRPGLVLNYRTRNASGSGLMTVEVVKVGRSGAIFNARCRRTTKWGAEKSQEEYEVLKDSTGVYIGSAPEFPLPPRVGRTWDLYPKEYRIEDVAATAKVPAGTFRNCLKISYLIGGGDGGFGERWYAPGVGFVRETCDDETDPFEHTLLSVFRPGRKHGTIAP